MRKYLLLALLSSCAATFDADAEASCHEIFSAWREAAKACGLVATTPDENGCWRAYAVDDSFSGCIEWIRSNDCEGYSNATFQAHCGKAITLRTW